MHSGTWASYGSCNNSMAHQRALSGALWLQVRSAILPSMFMPARTQRARNASVRPLQHHIATLVKRVNLTIPGQKDSAVSLSPVQYHGGAPFGQVPEQVQLPKGFADSGCPRHQHLRRGLGTAGQRACITGKRQHVLTLSLIYKRSKIGLAKGCMFYL